MDMFLILTTKYQALWCTQWFDSTHKISSIPILTFWSMLLFFIKNTLVSIVRTTYNLHKDVLAVGGWPLLRLPLNTQPTTAFSPHGTYLLICSLVHLIIPRRDLCFLGLHSLVSLHMHQIPMARFGEFYISQLFTTHLLHHKAHLSSLQWTNSFAKPKRKKLGPSECMLCLLNGHMKIMFLKLFVTVFSLG